MTEESLYTALYIFALLNMLDFMTTRVAIRYYKARELNPLARAILEKAGFVGLYAFKMFMTALLPLLAYFLEDDFELSLWIWNALLGLVVAWNSAQLARIKVSGKK